MDRFTALAGDALVALRQNPLRSLLSILGLVIGVAALVAILALADGMERYAREQIATTTDLQLVSVAPRVVELVDGVPVPRERVAVPTLADAARLDDHLGGEATVVLVQRRAVQVIADTVRTAAALYAADAGIWALREADVARGTRFDRGDVEAARPAVVISAALAKRLGGGEVVGRALQVGNVGAEVVGVLPDDGPERAEVYGPITAFGVADGQSPPGLVIRAERAEDVAAVAGRVEAWLEASYPEGLAGFTVSTDAMRAGQIRQGMLLFKLVFGLITGISVVVGGVGVMNVLLVSVTERTREIGIRKAVGARRRDIQAQFLAEAMTVAGAGSLLGLAVGMAAVFAVIPVIRHFTEVSLHAAITVETLLVVGAVALGVGILFGTYPASRAARLAPVDAMRHE